HGAVAGTGGPQLCRDASVLFARGLSSRYGTARAAGVLGLCDRHRRMANCHSHEGCRGRVPDESVCRSNPPDAARYNFRHRSDRRRPGQTAGHHTTHGEWAPAHFGTGRIGKGTQERREGLLPGGYGRSFRPVGRSEAPAAVGCVRGKGLPRHLVGTAPFYSAMAERSGLTKKAANDAVEAVLEPITNALANDEKVTLVGFG